MGTIELRALTEMKALIAAVHDVDEPVIVVDGDDECLVAMSPAVFERILFDTDLLNAASRETLHL